jgi:hypothetical protein
MGRRFDPSRGATLVLVATACAGCAEDKSEYARYLERVAEAACDWSVRCGAHRDRADCLAQAALNPAGPFLARYDREQVEQSIAAGRTRFDPAAANECVQAITAVGCNLFVAPAHRVAALPSFPVRARSLPFLPCQRAVIGTIAEGAPCTTNSECASGSCFTLAICTDQATCLPAWTHDPVGAPCTGSGFDDSCEDSANCEDGVCVMGRGIGEPCGEGVSCAAGLGCGRRPGDVEFKCYAPAAPGAPCCCERFCDSIGYVCVGDDAERTCQPRLLPGDVCDPGLDRCTTGCDTELLRCKPVITHGGPGAPCQAWLPTCGEGLYCSALRSGVCKSKKPDGSECWRWEECASGYCQGVCASELCEEGMFGWVGL